MPITSTDNPSARARADGCERIGDVVPGRPAQRDGNLRQQGHRLAAPAPQHHDPVLVGHDRGAAGFDVVGGNR